MRKHPNNNPEGTSGKKGILLSKKDPLAYNQPMNIVQIKVDETLPINPEDVPPNLVLDRDQVWAGLMLKVYDATPFVPLMTMCKVTDELENGIVRDIVFDNMSLRERIICYPKSKVEFIRVGFGDEMGTIWNEIIGDDIRQLKLRFAFNLEVANLTSDAERDYREKRASGYLKAVQATINQIRGMHIRQKI